MNKNCYFDLVRVMEQYRTQIFETFDSEKKTINILENAEHYIHTQKKKRRKIT